MKRGNYLDEWVSREKGAGVAVWSRPEQEQVEAGRGTEGRLQIS